jgi:hypothetical protein
METGRAEVQLQGIPVGETLRQAVLAKDCTASTSESRKTRRDVGTARRSKTVATNMEVTDTIAEDAVLACTVQSGTRGEVAREEHAGGARRSGRGLAPLIRAGDSFPVARDGDRLNIEGSLRRSTEDEGTDVTSNNRSALQQLHTLM